MANTLRAPDRTVHDPVPEEPVLQPGRRPKEVESGGAAPAFEWPPRPAEGIAVQALDLQEIAAGRWPDSPPDSVKPGELVPRRVPAPAAGPAERPAPSADAIDAPVARRRIGLRVALVLLAVVAGLEGIYIVRSLSRGPEPAVIQAPPVGQPAAAWSAESPADTDAGIPASEPETPAAPPRIAAGTPTVATGGAVSAPAALAAAAPRPGQLLVRSDPPGARVFVDGAAFGITPLRVSSIAPGVHRITLDNGQANLTQNVSIEAGSILTLVVPLASSSPPSGWLTVAAPIEFHVYSGDRLVSTSRNDRILMEAGLHQLSFVNEAIGYRTAAEIRIDAGKTSTFRVEIPPGQLSLNAVPWAEVTVDGARIGVTPIGNLSISAGPHEVVFRHPELGEQRRSVMVAVGEPTRVSVRMAP
jgi:hypothetical protein